MLAANAPPRVASYSPEKSFLAALKLALFDVSAETPRRSDVSAETPRAVDVSAETPRAVDVSAETPRAFDVSAETPRAFDVSAETPRRETFPRRRRAPAPTR